MKKIRYIGKKPSKVDNVAGTGIMWPEQGAVREVPDNAADKLLLHPDVWAIAGSKAAGGESTQEDSGEKEETETSGENGKEDDSDLPPLENVNAMNADQLRDYAQRQFGHQFHPRTGESKMRDTIVCLMNKG